MKKYFFVFSLYWQEGLAKRSSFFMERFRALAVLISLYYLWTALLAHQSTFAGYSHSQMLTYVFAMSVMRSLVFATRTDEIPMEINQGRLSGYLLKPVNFFFYTLSRDLAEKSINLISSIFEIALLISVFSVQFQWPQKPSTWLLFILASMLGMALNYFLNFMVACCGFWTSESSGPRFLLALIMEFTAGSFFPLDILPAWIVRILHALPSPYMVFFPLNVFLEKLTLHQIINAFAIQTTWVVVFALLARWVWSKGTRYYGAEGA